MVVIPVSGEKERKKKKETKKKRKKVSTFIQATKNIGEDQWWNKRNRHKRTWIENKKQKFISPKRLHTLHNTTTFKRNKKNKIRKERTWETSRNR